MSHFTYSLCAATAIALALATFVTPRSLNAGPVVAQPTPAEPVPGMAERFHAEKVAAPQQELPPQF